jgi:hypothetical protein
MSEYLRRTSDAMDDCKITCPGQAKLINNL